MKKLEVPFISLDKDSPISDVSAALNDVAPNSIELAPWAEFSYKPHVTFAVAYSEDSLLVKYFVKEKAISAFHREINSPVYKDTCVEMFIAFDEEPNYYNLEFNCVGTCLAGYGKSRVGRKLLAKDLVDRIKYLSKVKSRSNSEGNFCWELTLMIPFEVFCHHEITSLKNRTCRVNFYKCGDDLPEPHYLSWSSIKSPSPNFHLPEFFGEAEFV